MHMLIVTELKKQRFGGNCNQSPEKCRVSFYSQGCDLSYTQLKNFPGDITLKMLWIICHTLRHVKNVLDREYCIYKAIWKLWRLLQASQDGLMVSRLTSLSPKDRCYQSYPLILCLPQVDGLSCLTFTISSTGVKTCKNQNTMYFKGRKKFELSDLSQINTKISGIWPLTKYSRPIQYTCTL